jgi:hypothetical protein
VKFRLLLAAAAVAFLSACLDPVYEPASVFDPEPLIADEPMATYDSVSFRVLPLTPLGQPVQLWKGDPKKRPRLPLYKGAEGESLDLEMKGWKKPSGLCFIARFRGEKRIVEADSCGNLQPHTPIVTSVSPSASPKPTWTWSSPDGMTLFRYSLDDANFTTDDWVKVTTYTPPMPLADGYHVLYVQQSDGAGGWSAAGSAVVLVSVGPVDNFRMDSVEVSGVLTDDGFNHTNAIPVAVLPDTDRHGNPGGAARFNGAGTGAVVGNVLYNAGNRITITAWIKADSARERRYFLYSQGGFAAFVDSNGCGLEIRNPELGSGSIEIEPRKWTFFAATFDGRDVVLYENGQYMSAFRHGGDDISGSLSSLYIGSEPDSLGGFRGHIGNGIDSLGGGFKGSLDDLRIYNRVLTLSDIEGIYKE